MTGAPLLAVAGLNVAYGKIAVLHDVGLTVAPGEAVALLGGNGSGKSSLLRAVMGLVPAVSGAIDLAGTAIAALPPERRARLGLGYAPEGRRVFAGMSVADNLDVACRAGAAERRRRRASVMALFPQLAEHEKRRAWQLSGGQQQMLAIGRALMTAPRILLLDEPSLGLSPLLTAQLLTRIRTICDDGMALLLAEQNAVQALAICDRAYVLESGRVVAAGPGRDLARDSTVRRAFLGADPLAPG
jgi:branched-chain amino acid transport system ATP-binding protein